MRLLLVGIAAALLWAAFILFSTSFQTANGSHLLAAAIMTAAVAIQRLNGIQQWLAEPKNKRKDQIRDIAQQTLINICTNRKVTAELLELCVHVWEVPLWYRRAFPYWFRRWLKRIVLHNPLRTFARWAVHPTLHRVAAVGLLHHPPSDVRFRKFTGLIGVCIGNNDRNHFMILKTSTPEYEKALQSPNEETWRAHGTAITHNLPLKDALKLSHSYGQVVARVIQDPNTGEAIGCATISIREKDSPPVLVTGNHAIDRQLNALANTTARLLA